MPAPPTASPVSPRTATRTGFRPGIVRLAALAFVGSTLLASSFLPTARADASSAGALQVVSIEPAPHTVAPRDAKIRIEFDRPIDSRSVTCDRGVSVFGRWSGAAVGEWIFTDDEKVLTLIPERGFSAGETVTIQIGSPIRSLDGSRIRPEGYEVRFRVGSTVATRTFSVVSSLA